jgi:hypothetical protein
MKVTSAKKTKQKNYTKELRTVEALIVRAPMFRGLSIPCDHLSRWDAAVHTRNELGVPQQKRQVPGLQISG